MRGPINEGQITGVVLAGGRGRRLGGRDKGLFPYQGRPLVEWVLTALAGQVGALMINANRNLPRYRAYGHPVVVDRLPDFPGPLAGIASAMAAAPTPWICVAPCDAPLLPHDLVQRLSTALTTSGGDLALAFDGTRVQRLHALLPVSLRSSLEAFLAHGGRKVADWHAEHHCALADLGDRTHAFANINTGEDAAPRLMASGRPGPRGVARSRGDKPG